MYPYLRLIRLVVKNKFNHKKIYMGDDSILPMRVGLVDIDPFLELNNGRHLTLMDFGRFDLAMRSGLMKVVKDNKWGLAVAGASVRYRHRLKYGQKFILHSSLVGYDEKWFYFHQKTVRNDKIHSAALVRTAVTSKDGIVSSEKVLKEMGYTDISYNVPHWVTAWAESDEIRPWE